MINIKIGDKARLSKTISDEDVKLFATISGDFNPLHLDENFAKKTRFGKRIVHGLLTASLISALLGTKLPGPGSIYLSQTLFFLKPVYVGDTITAEVEVIDIDKEHKKVKLKTTCYNQNEVEVIKGEAILLLA
jgi:3-hydroxybutyryl-CoA dehydratase